MISINGVTLSQDLYWDNEFTTPLISQQEERTILGNSILITAPLSGGRDIRLKAYRSGTMVQGYFTYEQIQQFRVLEQTGQQVEFIYESTTLNVVIKAGGVGVIPHIERPNPDATDNFSGTLILKEV